MIEIPAGICAAVHAGEMPLPILADWLEDHDWPQAARGVRYLDELALEIRHLHVPLGQRRDWDLLNTGPYVKHRSPSDIPLFCATLAWSEKVIPVNYGHCVETQKYRTYHKYHCPGSVKLKCSVCNRKRDTNLIQVCRECHRLNRKLDAIIIPDVFTIQDLQRERTERAARAARKSVEKRKSP